MLDVGGNCSIALFLRRSFAGSRGSVYCLRGGEAIRGAGFKRQCILFAWRRGHQRCGAMRVLRSHARPTRPLRRLAGPFHQEAMAQLCGPGPRGS